MTRKKGLLTAIILFYLPIMVNAETRDNALNFFKFAAKLSRTIGPNGTRDAKNPGILRSVLREHADLSRSSRR